MTSHQPQPPVRQNPQQPVIVVNQPIDPRLQSYAASRAYLHRGAKFSNGCRCYLVHMTLLIVIGFCLLMGGTSTIMFNKAVGILTMLIGGVLFGLGIHLVLTARKQFDNLPPDHPDRTRYTVQIVMYDPTQQTPTVYAMPPMQNQATSYPPTTAGQNYFMPNSGATTQFVPQPGGRSPHDTYDPPPAYSDVVRNK